LSAIRPSAIIRSMSRREAMPARASSLAMRCGPFLAGRRPGFGPRGGCAPLAARSPLGAAPGHASFVAGALASSYGVMLFGKRKRIVNRILIVEDEPLTAFDNENLLRDEGYEVVATLDAFAEAVDALDREQVDLILSDVRLTGKRTGIDLARKPRSAASRCCSSPAHRRTMPMSWRSAA
jgi:hypothetical protein